jgi:TIR domain
MKVFLSHSTKDKQFVQALSAELEAEKIEPWLCQVDIELGANFVAKIEEGLRDADLTVLFGRLRPRARTGHFGGRPRNLRITDASGDRAAARLRGATIAPC